MRRKDHGPTRWEKAAKEKGRDHRGAGIVGIPRTYKGTALKPKEKAKETEKAAKVKDIQMQEEAKAIRAKVMEREEKEKDIPRKAAGIKEREEDS